MSSNEASLSGDAKRLASAIEHELAEGHANTLSADAFQALMAALCRNYSARIEAGDDMLPLSVGTATATDVMVTTSKLLKAANLQVFELGMWQSWGGR